MVIDANVAVWAVLPVLSPIDALELFAGWRQQRLRLLAPTLWLAECVSAIRGATHARMISLQQGQVAVEDIFALEVEPVPINAEHCRSAFDWATRLGQARAYDGFYLALAERLRTELWTGDRRLTNAARQMGVGWVHWVGETEEV